MLDWKYWAIEGEIKSMDQDIIEADRLIRESQAYRQKALELSDKLAQEKFIERLDDLDRMNSALTGSSPIKNAKVTKKIPPVKKLEFGNIPIYAIKEIFGGINNKINKKAREELERVRESHVRAVKDTHQFEFEMRQIIQELKKKREDLLKEQKRIKPRIDSMKAETQHIQR
ncbi:MAG: hypothetical protein CUN55_15295 [Phototrophicales bacterium]|nr:MAG: hypothetical protein CUN55_15295 [Phototrophicales bacterium]